MNEPVRIVDNNPKVYAQAAELLCEILDERKQEVVAELERKPDIGNLAVELRVIRGHREILRAILDRKKNHG